MIVFTLFNRAENEEFLFTDEAKYLFSKDELVKDIIFEIPCLNLNLK